MLKNPGINVIALEYFVREILYSTNSSEITASKGNLLLTLFQFMFECIKQYDQDKEQEKTECSRPKEMGRWQTKRE